MADKPYCFDDNPLDDVNGVDCSRESFISFIRENIGDCKSPYSWSDDHLNQSLDISLLQAVNNNKEEFTRVIDVTLVNDECVQNVCCECDSFLEIVGNVNNGCDTPKTDVNNNDKWLNKMYPVRCSSHNEKYNIESYEVLGDGGCNFMVKPKVPKNGDFKLKVLCFKKPSISNGIPSALCGHYNEILFLALGIVHMLEDDRDVLTEKADRWFNLYFKIVDLDQRKDQDIFLESMKFGARINKNEE